MGRWHGCLLQSGAPKKLRRDRLDLAKPRSQDRHLTPLRNDPQRGAWNRAIHFNRNDHRKENVTVTVDDEGSSLDCAQVGWCKVHVVIAVFERCELLLKLTQLIGATLCASLPCFTNLCRHLLTGTGH